MRECEIYKSVVDYLRGRKCLVFKHRDLGSESRTAPTFLSSTARRGVSATSSRALPTGKFLAIKIRRKRKKATPEQCEFMKSVMKNDQIGIFAHSVEDVRKVF